MNFESGTWLFNTLVLSASILGFLVSRRLISNWIKRLSIKKQVAEARTQVILRAFYSGSFFVFLCFAIISLDIGLSELALFMSSVFAVLGVALVAQWSILSNITASVLIFFVFPYRIGDNIRVIEKDYDVSGTILDIGLFHVLIRHSNGEIITYPNNLMLQKGVVKLQRNLSTPMKPLEQSEANQSTEQSQG